MAKNSVADWSTTAADNTDVGGVGITGSSLPSNLDNAMRELMAQIKAYSNKAVQTIAQTFTNAEQRQAKQNIGVPFSLYTNNGAADYIVVAADNGRTVDVSASSASRTVTLPSAATVGVGFVVTIRKNGTGFNTVTVIPNGADLINALTSYVLRLPEQGVTIQVVASGFWRVVGEAGTVFNGSNANGSYTRWADGTQICTFVGAAADANVAQGNVFRSTNQVTWTFPIAFGTTVGLSVVGAGTHVSRWVTAGPPTTSSVAIQHNQANISAAAIDSQLQAVGRWY